MRLEGKTAWITGGNSGIGLATAKLYVAEGAKVAITGRNQKTLDEAKAELGADVLAIVADTTNVEALESAAVEIGKAFGKIDIVFANAGIGGRTPLGETTLSQFQKILDINLTGVFFTIQAALPYLVDGGSVILNGSVHTVLGVPGSSAYAATKAGVRAMTRNLASELAPRRIRVNQVTPGATRTPIWADREAIMEKFAQSVPLARLGEAAEVAQAALFLASDDSVYITGTEIVVDGGAIGAPYGAPIYR